MLVGSDSSIRYVNDSVTRVLGYRPRELVGQRLDRYLCASGGEVASPNVEAGLRGPVPAPETLSFRMRAADGRWRCVEAIIVDLPASVRSPGHAVYYIRDASERDAERRELERRASEDSLTGLANRSLFMNRLKAALSGRARHRMPVAVLFLDLDDFKLVNDRLGHGAGDRLLVALGQRLQACIRPGDMAARLGGDEFTVLMEDAIGTSPSRLAERLLSVLGEPVAFDGHTLSVSLSIGVAVSSTGYGDADRLLHAADAAMYRAKQEGKGHCVVADEGILEHPPRRFISGDDLRRAVERSEFGVRYRPVVSLVSGDVISMEALLRWEHPNLGLLSPEAFVPMAERSGLMSLIGRWLLHEACDQAAEWRDLGMAAPATISVPLSAKQLMQPTLAEQTADILQETGCAPGGLALEIPESVILADRHRVTDNLQRLDDMNVKLTLRNFGAVSTPLSDLVRLPFGVLKIDRALVGALRNGTDRPEPTISAILRVAGVLGIGTVAEGVKSLKQTMTLKYAGCDAGQGPYFSGPLQGTAATEFLEATAQQTGMYELRTISTGGDRFNLGGRRRTEGV
jgi:diguanylate cyclase (GGDEF)-like protein/PAS domain S-box-containing protein